MRLIKDGGEYNMVLCHSAPWADSGYMTYRSVEEPTEQMVASMLIGGTIVSVQYINYYLQETNAGYIFEAEDPIFVKAGFNYLECLKWIHERYENKEFSWQSVAGDVE